MRTSSPNAAKSPAAPAEHSRCASRGSLDRCDTSIFPAARRTSRSRRGSVHALAAVCLAAAALAAGVATAGPRPVGESGPAELPAYPSIEGGGLRYEYDALIGRERLLAVRPSGAQPVDVSAERPDDLARMRAMLLRRLGLTSLETLREAHREAADALRRLGYI